jgi:DNA topoisomerase-3
MKGRVIITEKKLIAEALAKALKLKQGRGCYDGEFEGAPVKVVWASGHLLTMQDPEEVNPGLGWNNPHALAQIPRNVKLRQITGDKPSDAEYIEQRMSIIKSALANADEVILGTDADREGEYIGWSILEHFGWKKGVRRFWPSAGLDEISMNTAMSNLLPASEKKAMARAAEARARCDWSYMYLVRLLTFYGRKGLLGTHLGTGQGRESVVSIGRVQSAALYMIYKREMDIRNFVPKAFYKVSGTFGASGAFLDAEYAPKVTRDIIASMPPGVTWEPQGLDGENKMDKPLFTGAQEVKEFKQRAMAESAKAKVHDYQEGKKEKHPPITFDLVAAKSELSKACKISGDVAQAVIEDLYEQGYISYPRTNHGELPMNLYEPAERDSRLRCVAGLTSLKTAAKKAFDIHTGVDPQYKAFKPKVFVTKPLEHYGLIPSMKKVNDQILLSISPQKKIKDKVMHTGVHMATAYRLIAEQFVQAMLPPTILATQKITFSVPVKDLLGADISLFAANAERTIDAGWQGIMSNGGNKAAELPKLSRGDSTPLKDIKLAEGKTKPPGRYNEDNFERAMQNAAREVDDPELRKYMAEGSTKPEGIGTPATRKDIVPTLKVRGYMKSDKSRTFFLEPKGQQFIDYLKNNGHHWMYRIETTAQWEGQLADLAALRDDVKSMAMRDEFIESTLTDIETFIRWMNDKYDGQEGIQRERIPTVVSPKMKETIKSIAERKNIKLPAGTLSDPAKAKKFLDEHTTKRDPAAAGTSGQPSGGFAPSEPQLKFLERVEAAAGVKATDEDRADRAKLSAFIDKHKAKMGIQPPTEKMLKFAQSLAAKLPADQQPDKSVFEGMETCSKFIDTQTKSPSKAAPTKGGHQKISSGKR